MRDEELLALATLITKTNQRYFWAPGRRGERIKITRAFNILKDVEHCGYKLVPKERATTQIEGDITGSSKGRTTDFGSVNLGSSPSPVTNDSNGETS